MSTKRLFDSPAARKTGGDSLERLISETLAIETESAQEAGAMGYMARAMVQATMPHKRTEALFFKRTNGNFTLMMSGNAEVGLPYGTIPRLLVSGHLGAMEQKPGLRDHNSSSPGSPGFRRGRSSPRATDSGRANA